MRILTIFPALLALAACADRAPDLRGVDRDETLLQVSATGQAETRPDEARFSVGVETRAGSAAAATDSNNEDMEALVAALAELGIEERDIQTSNVTIQRVDYGPERGRFVANNTVEVRVRDIDRAGEAIGAATEAGANVLWGPRLEISDREAANRSAYAAAYRAARSRAEAYAEAAGLQIGRILAIRDGGDRGTRPPIPYAVEMDAAAVAPQTSAPPVRPGTTVSEVTVSVDFALTEAD